MYETLNTSVGLPELKHHADYKDRGNWGTAKTRNIHRVVYSFKHIRALALSSGIRHAVECDGEKKTNVVVFILLSAQQETLNNIMCCSPSSFSVIYDLLSFNAGLL